METVWTLRSDEKNFSIYFILHDAKLNTSPPPFEYRGHALTPERFVSVTFCMSVVWLVKCKRTLTRALEDFYDRGVYEFS